MSENRKQISTDRNTAELRRKASDVGTGLGGSLTNIREEKGSGIHLKTGRSIKSTPSTSRIDNSSSSRRNTDRGNPSTKVVRPLEFLGEASARNVPIVYSHSPPPKRTQKRDVEVDSDMSEMDDEDGVGGEEECESVEPVKVKDGLAKASDYISGSSFLYFPALHRF
tara:strand:+ start:106 stop:606 length:501 start_codon:yes stop_codon:yes gene_type:complete